MLGYEFLKLDAEQKAARRYLLNLYGTIGQWSILAVLVFVQLAVLVRWAVFRTSSVERPRSPHPNKAMALGKRAWFGRVDQRLTRFRWWADEPLRQGWFTKGECILGFVWTVWLLFLSVHRTGNGELGQTPFFASIWSLTPLRLPALNEALWHGCSITTPTPIHSGNEISILAHSDSD